MRLLVLAVLALAAVAVGATCVPHGGCDCDFGAGNGTAYLVVDNPYGLTLPLDITYHIGGGERSDSMVLNVSETRAVVFCGLGDGWLYIQQHASPLRSPLVWYPLAVPRYVVLRAGESATMSVTTLFAPAATIAVAFLLLVAVAFRPRLRRSAVYALPDALRDADIWGPASNVGGMASIAIVMILIILILLLVTLLAYGSPLLRESPFLDVLERIRSSLSFLVGHVDDIGSNPAIDIIALLVMYMTSSLGGFYLTFRRGLWTYNYLLISFLINLFLFIKWSKSLLFFLLFTLSITILLTSSVILISFYNLFMAFFLSAYGIAIFIYYDANFGRTITWGLPLQIPAIVPEIWIIAFPLIAASAIFILLSVIIQTHGITRGARAVMPYTAFWPPLWWWFGLGVFTSEELGARSLLHRLSAGGGVVVELSRGRRAFVVSADLYGMYLCRFGGEGGVCNDVEWVRYGEVKFKVSRIIKGAGGRHVVGSHVVGSFVRKVVLPILVGVLAFFTTKYTGLPIILTFPLFLIIFLPVYYKYNDSRELKEYVQAINQDIKVYIKHWLSHIIFALIVSFIFSLLTSDPAVSGDAFFTAITISFLSRADPKLSSYLFPELELRLMSMDGLVIGLARGGCLQWMKVGVAPRSRAFVIRDGDCLVVVSPYVENVRNGLRRYLCGPACPVVRVVGGERVAVGVVDLQRRWYAYYVEDSSR